MSGWEVRSGYRLSQVGVIPEDWDVAQIRDYSTFVTSGSRGWGAYYSDNGSAFVRITDLTRSEIYIDVSNLRFVDLPKDDREGQRTQLIDGDILISITADIGIIGYVSSKLPKPAYINQHIALIRFDEVKVSPRFIGYFLSSSGPQKRFGELTDAGAKAGMNLATVQQIQFALPSTKAEQEAIAGALGDADGLIEALERLIAKKRALKQGAMQELLTGKRRLPGFDGKWQERAVSAIAPLKRGFDLPNSHLQPGPYPVIYSNGLLHYHSEFQVRGPGLVTGRSGTIGRVNFIDQDFWPHNTTLWVTSFHGNDPRFIYYLYDAIGFERFATGSGVPTLNRNDVHGFNVNFPNSLPEQTAIATILSDMDAEIAALETKLGKAQNIKQGMMQELLTGKTRLT